MPFNNIISRTDAEALIPEEVTDTLLKNLVNESAALQLFNQVRMSRGQQRMPVLAALPTAYFVNGDTGLKQTTEVNWDNKYLNAEELASIVPIPEAVLDDTAFDVWEQVRPLMEQAIGRALDAAIFFGTNKPASWPDEIVAAAIAAGNDVERGTSTQAQGGIAGDFNLLFGEVESDGFDVNGVIANRSYKGLLRNARNAQGSKLPEISPEDIWGAKPIFPLRGLWPAGLSVAEAIAGDFTQGILGIRQDITFKLLDQAVIQDNTGAIIYNLAQQDMVALRVVARFAFQVANVISYDEPTEGDRYPFGVLLSPAA